MPLTGSVRPSLWTIRCLKKFGLWKQWWWHPSTLLLPAGSTVVSLTLQVSGHANTFLGSILSPSLQSLIKTDLLPGNCSKWTSDTNIFTSWNHHGKILILKVLLWGQYLKYIWGPYFSHRFLRLLILAPLFLGFDSKSSIFESLVFTTRITSIFLKQL